MAAATLPAKYGARRDGQADQGRLTPRAEVFYLPAVLPGEVAQLGVGVDRGGAADQGEQRQIVGRITVGGAAGQIEPLPAGQSPDGLGLGGAVEQVADQAAGVDAVLGLRDGAEGTGQAEALGDHAGQLHRGRGDQPDSLTGVEVCLRDGAGARPDTVGHHLVVDLLAQPDDLLDLAARHKRQRGLPGLCDVGGVLVAADPEDHLAEREPEQVLAGEQASGGEAPGEMVDGRAAHHGVVDVEEGGGHRVGFGHRHRHGGCGRDLPGRFLLGRRRFAPSS